MLDRVIETTDGVASPVTVVTKGTYDGWLGGTAAATQTWLRETGFQPKPGAMALLPGDGGVVAGALAVVDDGPDLWSFAGLPGALPAGTWRLAPGAGVAWDGALATDAALGWMLGCYRFDRYRKSDDEGARVLVAPDRADMALARRLGRAVGLARDLVNTPANDMGPEELEAAAADVARAGNATFSAIVGDALLDQNYPMIHAVGRGSARAPRLLDMRWGRQDAPKVTLVGKGVCFDSGGLDLKTADGMRIMKKDMGGAAAMLGLAGAVMDANLGLRLRLLIPAVENSVSSNAYRPGDVIATRAGKWVEIGNTDAEGRLVLCDALAEADSEAPDLVIDMATLTGAARVALGTDVAAVFTDDDSLAGDFERHAAVVADPLGRLPLWRPYRRHLDSSVADFNNISDGPYGGAVTAALFLQEFLEKSSAWAHFDIMAWNRDARPGRPKGGEAIALRAIYATLAERFPA